jgi:hypothetical protein
MATTTMTTKSETRLAKAQAFARRFARKIAKIAERFYQVEIAALIFRSVMLRLGQTITILISRQGGKNETLISWVILPLAMLCPGIKIGVYAPTYSQATDVTMRRLKARLKHRKFADRLLTSNDKLVQFVLPPKARGPFAHRGEGSLIGVFSHDKDSKKEGFTWDVIVVDEAQDLDREVWEVEIEPMGASTNATCVFIGTPWSIDCVFYDKIDAAKAASTHREFDWRAVASCSVEYAAFIAKKIADLGEDSIAFLTQYALQWVSGVGKFFDPDIFEALAAMDAVWLDRPQPGREYAGGLDVAGDDPNNTGKSDYTVLAIVEVDRSQVRTADDPPHTRLVCYVEWRGKDWEQQYRDMVALLNLWRPIKTDIDATGMGDSFSDRIEKAGFNVEKFKFTEQSKSDLGHYADQEVAARRATYAGTTKTPEQAEKLKGFKQQAKALIRQNRKGKKIAWFVPEAKGHDDRMAAWFLSIRAANTQSAASTLAAMTRM